MDIYKKLDEIGEYIEQAKTVPMINQKVIDPEYLMRSFEELYTLIPEEVKEAKKVIADKEQKQTEMEKWSEELKEKTKQECEKMLLKAKEQAEKLLDENSIKKDAENEAKSLFMEFSEQAKRLSKDAEHEAEHIRKEALERARKIEEHALLKAKKIKEDADRYAEQILEYIESDVVKKIDELNSRGKNFFSELREKDLSIDAVNL